MAEKKVLIIAYYWPPSGGSGVQRWLKFVKYLPHFGVKPYVFTPANPSFSIKDESLVDEVPTAAEVVRFPIWEPYDIFFKLAGLLGGMQKSTKPINLVAAGKDKTFFQKISTWVRGNFFIPDPRIFWVRPASKFLEKFIHDNGIETIITTGPPHSIHLIGYSLKKKNKTLKWFADFRDPWSEWGFLDSLMLTSFAKKHHRILEAKVLAKADKIITITPFYVRRFEVLAKRSVHLLTNGFDEDDFKHLVYRKNEFFLIRHVGIVNEKCDPRPFLEAVKTRMEQNQDFAANVVIEFIGEVHERIKQYIHTSSVLVPVVKFTGNIPHKQLIESYGESSLLLLILTGYKDAEGYMPGKLFEYLATGLPIFAVGPVQGDAATLLTETGVGVMLASEDAEGIARTLQAQYDNWKNAGSALVTKHSALKYSRKMITKDLVDMLVS